MSKREEVQELLQCAFRNIEGDMILYLETHCYTGEIPKQKEDIRTVLIYQALALLQEPEQPDVAEFVISKDRLDMITFHWQSKTGPAANTVMKLIRCIESLKQQIEELKKEKE
jgi:hypothetical protein